MGRRSTFPGVRFSWKGACLELTSHGTEQQWLKNRLKILFYCKPMLAVAKMDTFLFRKGCFYVVLLAQWLLPSEGALIPHPWFHLLPFANWIHHPRTALFSLWMQTGPQVEPEAHRAQHAKWSTWLPGPSRLGSRSKLPKARSAYIQFKTSQLTCEVFGTRQSLAACRG